MSNPKADAAKAAAGTTGATAANLGNVAAGESAAITPTLESRAQGQGTGYSPTDLNAMKVGAAQAAGGATASANEAANLRAARSGNTASLATSQDENARNRARVLADTNLKIQSANAGLKSTQQENALRQLASMYGENIGQQTGEMGVQAKDIGEMATAPAWLTDLQTGMGMAETGALTGAKIATGT